MSNTGNVDQYRVCAPLRDELRAKFKEAWKASGLTHREFKARYRQDADYLSREPRASSDRLVKALLAMGLTVEFRVYDPNDGPVLPRFQTLDTSGWEI